MRKIAVIGAGKFGTAIAFACGQNDSNLVHLHSRDPKKVDNINYNGVSGEFDGLSMGALATTNMAEAIRDAEYIFVTVPSNGLIETISCIQSVLSTELASSSNANWPCLILCTKGVNSSVDDLFFSDVIKKMMPHIRLCVLSGPSFASEIVRGVMTIVSLASEKPEDAKSIKTLVLAGSNLSITPSSDLRGLQMLGSFKNVIGIRSGIEEGFMNALNQMGKSSHDAFVDCKNKIAILMMDLINEGRAIMNQTGCKSDTIFSPAGMGDILLTCTSLKSRNRLFGELIGERLARVAVRGKNQKEISDLADRFVSDRYFVADLVQDEKILRVALDDLKWNGGSAEGLNAAVYLDLYCQKTMTDQLPELSLTSLILQRLKIDSSSASAC